MLELKADEFLKDIINPYKFLKVVASPHDIKVIISLCNGG